MNFTYCPSCGHKGTVQKQDKTNYECTACKWHFWNNAKGSVAIAFVKDNQVLVSERREEPNKGKYDLPGGFVDFDETAQAAAIREIQEELDITLTEDDMEIIGVYSNRYMANISTIDVVFMVRAWKGEPKVQDDVAALLWKPFDFIDNPLFSPPYTGLSKELAARTQ